MKRFWQNAAALLGAALLLTACIQENLSPVTPTKTVEVETLEIDPAQASIEVGAQLQLEVYVDPSDAETGGLEWISRSPSIASVEDGLVKGLAPGTAIIRVQVPGGSVFANCTITVTEKADNPGGENPGGENPGGENPGGENPGGENPGGEDPGDGTRVRWADTGADVPALPSYNKVSSYADFPRMDITLSGSIQKDTYKTCTVQFRDPKGMYSEETDTGALQAQVKGRGNSSWDYAEGGKKPYRVKLDVKSKVFGMGGDRDWILLADSMDPSQMRNMVAQRVARVISMEFAPRFRTVELYINGNYQGTYTLIEHKETGAGHKVWVDPDSGEGFFVELDAKGDDPVQFTSSTFKRIFNFKEPEQPSSTQKAYFESLINDTEAAMKAKNWDKVHSLIEMDTWIQNYIVQELTMNVDGNMRLSTYFAKDKDTKLYMPMVWDFDLAINNASYLVNFVGGSRDNLYSKWFIKVCGGSEKDSGHTSSHTGHQTYYQYLFQDPAFVSRLKELWNLYYPRLKAIDDTYISGMAEYNAPAFKHAADAGKNPRVRSYGADNKDFFSTYTAAIDYMHDFYSKRLAWINTNINAL